MSPSRINPSVVAAKAEVVRSMLEGIESLPLDSFERFRSDPHAAAAGESYLRRALEALLDLGRHLLAKGFAVAAVEYKEIPLRLHDRGVIGPSEAKIFVEMAGYRNRMVHMYDEIDVEELYAILGDHRSDIAAIHDAMTGWLLRNVGSIGSSL